MRFLIFSDIHNDLRALSRLMEVEADYYFAAGDMVSWAKGLDAVGALLGRRAGKVYVLPGNHESEDDIARMCAGHGLVNFHGGRLEVDGFHVAGLGYSNPTPFNTPGEYREPEIGRRLEPFRGLKPLILICHCPPHGTPLDRNSAGEHCGSSSIRRFIDEEQPVRFFCGHIHEAAGLTARIGQTVGTNAGKPGYLLDLATI